MNAALGAYLVAIFTIAIEIFVCREPGTPYQNAPKFGALLRPFDFHAAFAAPLLLHSPVNELHSIEIKEHTNLLFLLT